MVASNSHGPTGTRALRDQSRRVMSDVKTLGTIATDSVGAGAHRLKERGLEMLDGGKETIARYRGQVKKYVAANPLKSLLIAVGVGTVLGLALRRRS